MGCESLKGKADSTMMAKKVDIAMMHRKANIAMMEKKVDNEMVEQELSERATIADLELILQALREHGLGYIADSIGNMK